jgi:hypothetical protein
MDQGGQDQGETRSVKTGRGIRKDVVCHRMYSTFAENIFTEEIVVWFGDLNIRRHVTRIVNCTDEQVLLPKEASRWSV